MKKIIILLYLIFIFGDIKAQPLPKDTLYLIVDRNNPKIHLASESWHQDSITNNKYLERLYSIEVPLSHIEKPWYTEMTFLFHHNSRPNPGLDPTFFDLAEIVKDSSFLSGKHVLTYDTLKRWKANKTIEVFSDDHMDERDKMPIVFIIDKADIKDGRMLLLQARFDAVNARE